ncbi:MAG TPA: patatin-like phospholipase family protein, partial [Hyphomicrobiales bacterium]|nr:patatin-like phospholipase family protein [Hyphomicrobiales bacterium]
ALSGGGADGAYGAGVLVGWSEAGTRPNFDIVTGVSTGALMASLAFLGPDYDPILTRVYTTTRQRDIFVFRGMRGVFGDGLLDNAPLRKRVDEIVDERMLAAVAAEHRKGRRLYVATTNLDAGRLVVWDIGAIAASPHPDRLKIYRDILIASAAIPGAFSPVYIAAGSSTGTQMHVDGGVKAPFLLRSFMVDVPARRKDVYVVVNGPVLLDGEGEPVEPNLVEISAKSIKELMRGLTYKTLYQAYVTTRHGGAGFHLAYMPDTIAADSATIEFEPETMRRVFEAGRTAARTGKVWSGEPPRLEALERL